MKNNIINTWFQSWNDPDWNDFENIFEFDAYYSESWGPEYFGLDEIKIWKQSWHSHSCLNEWRITKITHLDKYSFVEWYFSCCDKNCQDEFDGVSIIEWEKIKK